MPLDPLTALWCRAPRPGAQLFGAQQEEDGETAAAALSATAAQGPSLPSEGLAVDYCVFCYHGTHILRHDNMALLTKFVSERGFILPKRFTKCCAKHQRTWVDLGADSTRRLTVCIGDLISRAGSRISRYPALLARMQARQDDQARSMDEHDPVALEAAPEAAVLQHEARARRAAPGRCSRGARR